MKLLTTRDYWQISDGRYGINGFGPRQEEGLKIEHDEYGYEFRVDLLPKNWDIAS